MRLLQAGKIVNTHGIRGEVKIMPWADSPEFLAGFERLYIDDEPKKVSQARVHKNSVLVTFDGVSDFDSALALKNKTVFIDRDDVRLEEGRHFVADLIGLRAVDSQTGQEIGAVAEVLNLPANDVYVIKGGEREILIPAVPEFVDEINVDEGFIRVRVIEGM